MGTQKSALFETEYVVTEGFDKLQQRGVHRPGNHNASGDAHVSSYFRGIKDAIIERIEKYPVIAGCVAWMSDFEIISALAKKDKHVAIVLQKEDFLRPDDNDTDYNSFRNRLRTCYEKVPSNFCAHFLPEKCTLAWNTLMKGGFDYSSPKHNSWGYLDPDWLHPFRCAGLYEPHKVSVPRMHNKFLVFCDMEEDVWGAPSYVPREVWTGSYNMSRAACLGFENGVAIVSDEIAMAYIKEFADIIMLSEPLDWTTTWMRPQYTIGVSG